MADGPDPLRSQEDTGLEVRDPGETPLTSFEMTETVTGLEHGGGVENINSGHVTVQICAGLDEEMLSDDELKVSQKRKGTGSESSNTKMRRGAKLSQDGDSDFVPSQESQSLYSPIEIKRFLERTKGQRSFIMEDHFPDLKMFMRSAKLLTKKSGTADDILSDQEIYRLKKQIAKVKGHISSQDDEF